MAVFDGDEDSEIIALDGAELRYWPHFYSASEAERLFRLIRAETPWEQSRIRIAGREIAIPRLNAWYGDKGADYSYSGVRLATQPWTETLHRVKSAVENVTATSFNSALLNLYHNHSDSVDWHSDDEPELGVKPVVASLSLGEARWFEMRRRDNHRRRFKLLLSEGSLLLMCGDFQGLWQHRVGKEKAPCGERINITFRTVHNGREKYRQTD